MNRDRKIKDKQKYNNNQKAMSQAEKLAQSRAERERQRKIRSFIICLCSVFIAVILGAILCLTIFFPIENIVVASSVANSKKVSEYYSKEEIINASEVKNDKNLILTNVKDAALSVEKKLPYIGKAVVTRRFPNTLVITVTDSTVDFAIADGNRYILFNKYGKVLDAKAESRPEKCAVIEGAKVSSSVAGEKIVFEDALIKGYLNSLIEAFDKYSLNTVSKINFSNPLNIKFVCNNNVTFVLGTFNNLDSKIRMAEKSYKTEVEKGIINPIIIDLSVEKKAYVRPDSLLDEIEKTTVAPEVTTEIKNPDVDNKTENEELDENEDIPEDYEDIPEENNENYDNEPEESDENEEAGVAYG